MKGEQHLLTESDRAGTKATVSHGGQANVPYRGIDSPLTGYV